MVALALGDAKHQIESVILLLFHKAMLIYQVRAPTPFVWNQGTNSVDIEEE